MVSKARLDLPDPERPVKTIRESRGRSSEMSLRLCSRAPRMMSWSATVSSAWVVGWMRSNTCSPACTAGASLTRPTDSPNSTGAGKITPHPSCWVRLLPSPVLDRVPDLGSAVCSRCPRAREAPVPVVLDGCMAADRTTDRELAAHLLGDASIRVVRTVDGFHGDDWAQPSLLPDWNRAHVVAHLALNAEAIARALRSLVADEDDLPHGEPLSMYDSDDARDTAIVELAAADS